MKKNESMSVSALLRNNSLKWVSKNYVLRNNSLKW